MNDNKTENKAERKTFKAKVNVNTMLALMRYPEVRAYIDKSMQNLALDNPELKRTPTAQMSNRLVSRGEVLEFADKIEVSEQGHILVYPKEIFDAYSKRYIEMPCQMSGNVTKLFNETLARMPAEEATSYERKRSTLTARFTKTPIMELVKA